MSKNAIGRAASGGDGIVDVLVIGAGWSGLTAAARLASRGHSVTVVEKSRGPGGRSATRRAEGFAFDHGAQYFTARSEAFSRQVLAWESAGLVARWDPDLAVFGERPEQSRSSPAQRWVGAGGMNGVLRRLSEGLDCRWEWQVADLEFDCGRWRAESTGGARIEARSLILTAPPEQSAALLGDRDPLRPTLDAVDMQPCWAVMLGFDEPPEVPFEAAFVNEGPLRWIARNDSKPGRPEAPAWLGHASAEWSQRHLEDLPDEVAADLHSAMAELSPALGASPRVRIAHRWRYAMCASPLSGPILGDDRKRLVVAGDWCAGERIEGAWISGIAGSRRIDALL